MSVQIVVPTLGESVTEATVAQWLKQVGDRVERDEPLVELETDKVTLEVNAPAAGVLGEVVAEAGATVEVGAVLGSLSDADGAPAEAAPRSAKPEPAPAKPAAEPKAEPKAEPAAEPKAEPAGDGGGETVDVVVPALGESVTQGTVARWLKDVGEAVAQDEPLVELETDKVTLEVNAPAAGTLTEQVAGEGDTVDVGAVLGRLSAGAGAAAPAAKPAAAAGPAPAPAKAEESGGDLVMPAARKLLEEHGLSAAQVDGTGKGGRVTKEDVQRAIEKGPAKPAAAAAPSQATTVEVPAFERPSGQPRAKKDREERVRMTKLRRTIATRLKQAQNTAAMLTTFNEVDMTALMALRNQYKDSFEKKHGVRLGFMSFFAKAVVAALQDIPAVNAEIDGDDIVYKNYYDIGVAVGTPQGLVVPVVRDVDQLSFAEVEKTIGELGRKGRDGKLSMADLTGGTFTISNGGVYGSLMSTPILNPPQSGILGMHKIQQRPMVVDGGKIEARPMMYLAVSYDHRIIDGSEAVTFLVKVKDAIEDPQRLLLGV
ncbi:MAG: 2-oxoglutarate dehydrogenase complex dihydrolipoyllysine-residue succinyltransferase [Rhodospirillaceae bacterium]|nr:2-oxoglutarate dehydrogenase complex dihydrolipoyllysine-residue succinyltransferase [Rhodospirillaceae bacterium]